MDPSTIGDRCARRGGKIAPAQVSSTPSVHATFSKPDPGRARQHDGIIIIGDDRQGVGTRRHTDGDTAVYFPDANVLATGDVMNNNHRYQQADYANGGDIRGMVRATNAWLKLTNDQTKVQTGHGPLGDKKSIADYNAMVKAARDQVGKLVREGKSEAEVVAADPLKELNAAWAADPQGAVNFTKQVYNSFKRS
jgi:glyoxylase-like metal-dependent hydrolase (beta-lactamase superfamily II)